MARRACDGCRRRKVKCDGLQPRCSNCGISSLACEYSIPPRKRGRRFRLQTGRPSSEIDDTALIHNRRREQSQNDQASIQVSKETLMRPDAEHLPTPAVMLHGAREVLLSAIDHTLPVSLLEAFLNTCIDLYTQWLFPISPTVHESGLRDNVSLVVSTMRAASSAPGLSAILPQPNLNGPIMRPYALLTAVCAVTTSMLPATYFLYGTSLAKPLLRLSREVLRLYQDWDIEQPDSSSLVIWFFHSNAFHALGKTRLHDMGETLLAHEMRLYKESSFNYLE